MGPAIDAGAEEIVVVIMTPWELDEEIQTETPRNLLTAASTTLEWALLASFSSGYETVPAYQRFGAAGSGKRPAAGGQ
ncbi:MAG: hypothetical protein M5U34_17750 [Chloroflexi bacterium]|nr:hypothetical protein [Chloroflexota bacterium]